MTEIIENRRLRLGLLVNPYAGIGGEAGLKGSDGAMIRGQALEYSATLRAPLRTARFVAALQAHWPAIDWYAGQGIMGENILLAHGIEPVEVFGSTTLLTSARDTAQVCAGFLQVQPDMILFAGGDGTARDVLDVVHTRIPCLGIPAGVKMQSGVFALSPEAAAEIVGGIIDSQLLTLAEQDVRDIDEVALREGRVRSQYYGSLQVPSAPLYLQHLKQSGREDETLVLEDLAAHLSEMMAEGRLMLVGPGRTLAYWMESIGLPNTLVGFDAVLDGQVLQADLNSRDILALQQQYPDLLLVLSPTGQQGMLLGRGNQQLTPDFLRRLPKPQWVIVATRNKLAAFQGKPLIVDSNDPELDRSLCGLYPVVAAYHYQVLYPVNITYKIL